MVFPGEVETGAGDGTRVRGEEWGRSVPGNNCTGEARGLKDTKNLHFERDARGSLG